MYIGHCTYYEYIFVKSVSRPSHLRHILSCCHSVTHKSYLPEAPSDPCEDWINCGADVYRSVARLQGVAGTNFDDCHVLVGYDRVASIEQTFHPFLQSVVLPIKGVTGGEKSTGRVKRQKIK